MAERFPEPAEAKKFLQKKVKVETNEWDELKWGEHAHAFTVAHSIKAGVVDEIHGLLNKALAEGQSFEDFKKGMLAMMEKTGWYGREDKTKDDKSYINWRIRVIYDTNMRTAHAAARYRKQLQSADSRPIWVYKSKLAGKNRRQEHIALHNKAFRYDDPFWNVYYPPNGWECKCFVDTRSEAGADRDKIPVLSSDSAGNPPAVDGVDWGKMSDDTWKYNVGREALAPNFSKYEALKKIALPDGKSAWNHILAGYQKDMNSTRMTLGEFKVFLKRIEKKETLIQDINFQVGNLDMPQYLAMQKEGILDSKIMSTLRRLGHGSGNKNKDQKIAEELYDELYQVLQSPERIYENTKPENPVHGREFHFTGKKGKNGKIINVVLRFLQGLALQITTMGHIGDDHANKQYKKVW
jgi:hypothetical protein